MQTFKKFLEQKQMMEVYGDQLPPRQGYMHQNMIVHHVSQISRYLQAMEAARAKNDAGEVQRMQHDIVNFIFDLYREEDEQTWTQFSDDPNATKTLLDIIKYVRNDKALMDDSGGRNGTPRNIAAIEKKLIHYKGAAIRKKRGINSERREDRKAGQQNLDNTSPLRPLRGLNASAFQ